MVSIPRYKRDKYIFISNLNEVTANADHPITLNRDGYLLSENYATTKKISLAKWVKSRRNLVVSDNGNFSRMKAIANRFEDRGEALLDQAQQEVEDLGVLSAATMDQRLALVSEIEEACKAESDHQDYVEIIDRQLLINPNYLIGLEDFTIPVLMMTGMMHPVFEPHANEVKAYQENTRKLYEQQCSGSFGHKDALSESANFMVLHAYDYSSAYEGSKAIARLPEGIAISYGGPMKSRRWITSLDMGDTIESLSEKLPEPYLIATALTMGAVNGLSSQVPIHILGVGSPILIALIGQLLNASTAVSIDSTAPFKDANVGKLYGSRQAFLKMDMLKVAAYTLIDNARYTSRTPYFKQFERDFPSDWLAMRSELGVTSSSNVKDIVNDLKENPMLVEQHIPFFSRMRGGDDPMIERLRIDRAGHNYWILRNICVSVRNRMQQQEKMDKWMRYQVGRYKKIGSKKWSEAVETAFELSIKYRQ